MRCAMDRIIMISSAVSSWQMPMTEAHTYQLSTAENELGVAIAQSEEGENSAYLVCVAEMSSWVSLHTCVLFNRLFISHRYSYDTDQLDTDAVSEVHVQRIPQGGQDRARARCRWKINLRVSLQCTFSREKHQESLLGEGRCSSSRQENGAEIYKLQFVFIWRLIQREKFK